MKIDPQRSHRIFQKLLRVGPDLERVLLYAKSSVPGLMDLHLDVFEKPPGYRRIALGHYWKHPSGDMIPDPDMTIAVFFDRQLAQLQVVLFLMLNGFENSFPGDEISLQKKSRPR